ncbi:MAG: hypothetical protein GX752_06970 [Clostridium sp.]|nr:hypothetical protein [Clostridium sp.]
MKRLFKEKKGPMVLVALFLLVNIILYNLGYIEAKTAVLSTVASSYFSQHIEDFEFKKLKNYLYPIFMIIIYVILAKGSFQ